MSKKKGSPRYLCLKALATGNLGLDTVISTESGIFTLTQGYSTWINLNLLHFSTITLILI